MRGLKNTKSRLSEGIAQYSYAVAWYCDVELSKGGVVYGIAKAKQSDVV